MNEITDGWTERWMDRNRKTKFLNGLVWMDGLMDGQID